MRISRRQTAPKTDIEDPTGPPVASFFEDAIDDMGKVRRGTGIPDLLNKSEADYYNLTTIPSGNPPKGAVKLHRTPHSEVVRMTYPDGQYEVWIYDKFTDDEIMRLINVDRDRLEDALRYIWNFGECLLKVNDEDFEGNKFGESP
jgi:hypothetical protein